MSLDERVSELIKRIYCAGPDGDEWDRIAVELMQLTGAHAALTSLTDLTCGDLNSYRAYGPENTRFARGMEEYSEKYKDDPSLKWGFDHPLRRFCDSSDTIASRSNYLQNEYVRWNRDRFGSTHWYVGYTPPSNDLSFTYSLHFPASEGRPADRSIRLFRMLFDHLECAVRLQRRPFDPESPRSLIVLNGEGAVVETTVSAEKLLANGGALSIVGGKLTTVLPSQQPKLEAALARTSSIAATGSRPAALKITHPQGQRPWLLTIRPLFNHYGPLGRMQTGLLVEIHGYTPPMDKLEALEAMFDLTARETELVRLLTNGHSIESAAACMKITVMTARTHLRSVFAKTNTVRQSELVLLCAAVCRN